MPHFANFISAYVILSFATTVLSTILIGYRIHINVTPINGSRRRDGINHFMRMVLESAAIYSVMLLSLSISTIFPLLADSRSPGPTAQYHIHRVAIIVAVRVSYQLMFINVVLLIASPSPTGNGSDYSRGKDHGQRRRHRASETWPRHGNTTSTCSGFCVRTGRKMYGRASLRA